MKTNFYSRIRMFAVIAIGLVFCYCLTSANAQVGKSGFDRFKVPLNLSRYPQTTPKKALESVVKAITTRDFDYLMAQLADPLFVDEKVFQYKKDFRGPEAARILVAFDKFVNDVKKHFQADPSLARNLRRLHKEGEWEEGGQRAIVRLPGARTKGAYFLIMKGRWFLENRMRKNK